jgi:hypothetical protein
MASGADSFLLRSPVVLIPRLFDGDRFLVQAGAVSEQAEASVFENRVRHALDPITEDQKLPLRQPDVSRFVDVADHDGVMTLGKPGTGDVAHELGYEDLTRLGVPPADGGEAVSEGNPDVGVDRAIESDASAVPQDLLDEAVP